MRIGIVIPTLARYDAVGNDALGMYRFFERRGCKVRCFVHDVTHEGLPVERLARLKKFSSKADLVIYHHSTAWSEALEVLKEVECPKVLKYHNITPPEYFKGISSEFESACQIGRESLRHLGDLGFDLHLGDSSFNINDLRDSSNCEGDFGVVPPFHQTDELIGQPADMPTLSRLNDDFKNFICVGRLVPNKGYLDLVRAFAIYFHHFNNRSRLILIGGLDPRLARYTGEIKDLVREEGLETAVDFRGVAPTKILKAIYLTADLIVMCSRHEGFCVPLVEAMAFRLPIVALNGGAVGETVDNAGIIWDEFDETLFSVSMNRVLAEPETSAELGLRGQRRYSKEFSTRVIEKKFLDQLNSILSL